MNKFNIKYVDKLSGRQFEFYCGWLFALFFKELNSDNITVTPATNDHGADVLANDKKGNTLMAFQCKHLSHPYQSRIGYKALEETAAGKEYYHADKGILITNSFVSKRTIKDAKHMKLGILNRDSLIYMINHAAENVKIPGYSTVRMSRTLATILKSIQKANGFKSRNALIMDMVRRLKPTYLDTTQKKATYHIYKKMSLQDYELQKRLK